MAKEPARRWRTQPLTWAVTFVFLLALCATAWWLHLRLQARFDRRFPRRPQTPALNAKRIPLKNEVLRLAADLDAWGRGTSQSDAIAVSVVTGSFSQPVSHGPFGALAAPDLAAVEVARWGGAGGLHLARVRFRAQFEHRRADVVARYHYRDGAGWVFETCTLRPVVD